MRPTAVLAAALLAACGGSSGDGDGPPGVDASTPAAFDDGVARIDVLSTGDEGPGVTSITALLLDAPAPWPYDPAIADGSCRMWRRQPQDTCTPICDFDQACVGGQCRSLPPSLSAGTLAVAGAGTTEMVAFDAGAYQRYLQRALWLPETEVTVSAPGDVFAGFTVAARLPPPIRVTNTKELRLAAGVPLTLRWDPAGAGARVRVTLGADEGHGRYRSIVIECDVADADGGVTVPQSMVDVLADRSHWSCGDCFSHEVRRYRRGDTTAGGTTITLWAHQREGIYLVPEL